MTPKTGLTSQHSDTVTQASYHHVNNIVNIAVGVNAVSVIGGSGCDRCWRSHTSTEKPL
jgi:hypothetical protein